MYTQVWKINIIMNILLSNAEEYPKFEPPLTWTQWVILKLKMAQLKRCTFL